LDWLSENIYKNHGNERVYQIIFKTDRTIECLHIEIPLSDGILISITTKRRFIKVFTKLLYLDTNAYKNIKLISNLDSEISNTNIESNTNVESNTKLSYYQTEWSNYYFRWLYWIGF